MTDFEIKKHGNDFTVVPIKVMTELEQAYRKIQHLEAKIDALMLEFCPEEMSDEQMANWAKHQILVKS